VQKGAQAERAYYVQHWDDATLRQPIQGARGWSDKGNNNDETIVQDITEKGDSGNKRTQTSGIKMTKILRSRIKRVRLT
jgi:hypothetical protein